MNSSETTDQQLWHAAKTLGIPLRDVCYKDKLNDSPPSRGGYIINLANHTARGTHWVALWLEKPGMALYYDSFGFPPPLAVEDFCRRWGSRKVIFSRVQIQSIASGFCGQYCLDFLAFISRTGPNSDSSGISNFLTKACVKRYLKFLSQFI